MFPPGASRFASAMLRGRLRGRCRCGDTPRLLPPDHRGGDASLCRPSRTIAGSNPGISQGSLSGDGRNSTAAKNPRASRQSVERRASEWGRVCGWPSGDLRIIGQLSLPYLMSSELSRSKPFVHSQVAGRPVRRPYSNCYHTGFLRAAEKFREVIGRLTLLSPRIFKVVCNRIEILHTNPTHTCSRLPLSPVSDTCSIGPKLHRKLGRSPAEPWPIRRFTS